MPTRTAHRVETVVLLEGPSDVAAVRAVAAARGLSEESHRYRLVDMGGATNIRRHLEAARRDPAPVRVVGMCDAAEAVFFARALAKGHKGTDHPAVLAERGFQVCDADLEDELIRSLGPERVVRVLARLGLAQRLAGFQGQPQWRGRPLSTQLHRFAGVASGRKTLLAGALAAALPPDDVPAPLAQLVASLAAST